MTSPPPPRLARLVTLALLIMVATSELGQAAALYTLTVLGKEDGKGLVFDASGNVSGQTVLNFIRKQDGPYSVTEHLDANASFSMRAFVGIDGQTPTELKTIVGDPRFDAITASAVNKLGAVVGTESGADQGLGVAYSYTKDGGMQAVPLPYTYPGVKSSGYSLNDAGLIVGTVTGPLGAGYYPTHAFLSDGHSAWDLNTLIGPDTGLTLTDAFDINDIGQIIARGDDAQGKTHDYLLTPVPTPTPEPGAVMVLAAGGLAYFLRRMAIRSAPLPGPVG